MGTLAQTIANKLSNGIMSNQTKYLTYMFQQKFCQTWKYFCVVNRKPQRIVEAVTKMETTGTKIVENPI